MDSCKLKTLVDRYIKSQASYAIMINAPWGSGKTSWIKNNFSAEKNIIYVSLYGLKNKRQIHDKLFESIISLENASSVEIEKAGNMIAQTLSLFFKGNEGNTSSIGALVSVAGDALKGRCIKSLSKNKVLVFDDFERYAGSTLEALSYINEFVEHQNLKSIIVCNESAINDENYQKQKEKTIFHTYYLSHSDVIKAGIALSNYENLKSSEFLIGYITNFVREMKIQNLRTIIYAVDCFSEMFNGCKKINSSALTEINIENLVFSCMFYAVGYKDRGLSYEKLKSLSEFLIESDKKLDDDIENYFHEMIDPFTGREILHSVCDAICLGHADIPLIAEELQRKIGNGSPIERSVFSGTMIDLSELDFESAISNIIIQIREKNRQPASVAQLQNEVASLYSLIHNGAYSYELSRFENEALAWLTSILEKDDASLTLEGQSRSRDHKFLKQFDAIAKKLMGDKIKNRVNARYSAFFMEIFSAKDQWDYEPIFGNIDFHLTNEYFSKELAKEVIKRLDDANHLHIYHLGDFFGLIKGENLSEVIHLFKNIKDAAKSKFDSCDPSLKKFSLNHLITKLDQTIAAAEATTRN